MSCESFWHIRSAKYDKLYWTKDKSYLECIIEVSHFQKNDVVLDVGSGTGIIAKAVKPYVKHVVSLDISEAMLKKGRWEGFSVIKWDISDLLFANNTFDKVIARMVFHHISDNLDRVLLRCYDLLRDRGILIVAEGVPPSEEKDVVDWYSYMFSFKGKRRTFTETQLKDYLRHNGFAHVRSVVHIMKNSSVQNWLINSGLNKRTQKKILKLHLEANQKIKDMYNMKIVKGDCLIDTKNVIVIGTKKMAR